MINVCRLPESLKATNPNGAECALTDAVVNVIGQAARLARLKDDLIKQLESMEQLASQFVSEGAMQAIAPTSLQYRAELEKAFKTLSQVSGQLPSLHSRMIS